MRAAFSWMILAAVLFSQCSKSPEKEAGAIIPPPLHTDDFIKYTIRQGQQFCEQNSLAIVQYSTLKFTVKFDNSAIYQTANPANQEDINKLYGFSDNNSAHQDFSARFGWNWSRDSLRLFAYVYNNGVRDTREISAILPNMEYNCAITVMDSIYSFTLDDQKLSMPRLSSTVKGVGYKLYPYFGGNETAPHDISIWIREY